MASDSSHPDVPGGQRLMLLIASKRQIRPNAAHKTDRVAGKRDARNLGQVGRLDADVEVRSVTFVPQGAGRPFEWLDACDKASRIAFAPCTGSTSSRLTKG